NLLDGTDESLSANTTGTSITASYDSGTGVLTLSGTDTVANYQQVLRTIQYNNTSEDPTTTSRTIDFVASDAFVSGLTATTTVEILAVNDAPVLDNSGAPALPTITEDEINNSGMTVADLLATGASGNPITDVDGDPEGIAIVNRNNGRGSWEYSLDGGSNWGSFGTVSQTEALLLRSTDLVRFAPDGQNGNPTDRDFEFRAWDQSSGTAGTKVDVTTNGGSTAFSSTTEIASITTTDVNDAPVLDNSANLTLTTQAEDAGPPVGAVGTVITDLVQTGVNVTDVDASSQTGIAITAADTTNGTWWFTTNSGATWSALGAVSDASARVLNAASNTRIYFQSDSDYNGTVNNAITFRAWDRSVGTNGSLQNASTTGGTSAFSTVSETADITITAVNDSPLVGTNTGTTVAEGGTVTITTAMLNEADVDDAGPGLTYTVTSGPTNGQLELTSNAGIAITSFTQDDIDNNRVVFVHDGTQSTTDSFDFSLADGGEDSSTAATGTFNLTVTNVNDAPVVDNIEVGALAYTENDGAVVVTSTITFTDVDDTNIESAVVQITGNYVGTEDVLSFTNQNGITGSY
ncbi:MAG: cadherin-like domain-containing protein, partial [Rubripirellula sp.]